MNDAALLARIPDFIILGTPFLKATPAEEAGERFLFMEASNEDLDHQDEIVLQKALEDSAGYFLRHGNVDLSHYTLLGPRAGIANHFDYEIGKPIDVQANGKSTFVKAQLYQGDSPMARNANMVWDSITRQTPPARWYPSVGGAVLAKSVRIDPDTKAKVGVVSKVRWNNIALDRAPVNRTVPEVSTLPVGAFAKSLNGFVLIGKALTAGTATDSSGMAGGQTLTRQSLDRGVQSYWDFRERIAGAIRNRRVKPRPRDLMRHAMTLGLDPDSASEFVERFLDDIHQRRKRYESV